LPGEPLRVVLADGNDAFRTVLRRLLESDGRFRVVLEAGTGEAVLDGTASADVMLVDLALPGIDALTVVRTMSDRCPRLVIVMLSPSAPPYVLAIARDHGAHGILAHTADMNAHLPDKIVQLHADSVAAAVSPAPDY
jgi:DNA-binding NarL/FixJ family response regulator